MIECFVFYDDDKNIKAISSDVESYSQYNSLKIDEQLANDFLSGKKFLEHYFIKHSKLNLYTLEKKHSVDYKNVYSDAVKAKKRHQSCELIIKFDNLKKQYTFSLSNLIKEAIDVSDYNRILKFYVVKSDQINWILNTIIFRVEDIIKEDIHFEFKSQYEASLDNIEIFTRKYFENIGIVQ